MQRLQGQIPFKRKSYLFKANSFTKLGFTEKDNAGQLFTNDVTDQISLLMPNNRQKAGVTGSETLA